MHPTLHISTAVEYVFALSKSYGALYHLVATYSVKTLAFILWKSGLASPKSHIFRSQFELTSKFLGFYTNYMELLGLYGRFAQNEYISSLSTTDIKRICNVITLRPDHF